MFFHFRGKENGFQIFGCDLFKNSDLFVTCRKSSQAVGLDNLLYTPDADFSCFADLALTSPEDYYIEGQGSLLQ